MEHKKLLLISPSISDMYKDIISQLFDMAIDVDYIEDRGNIDDPDFIRIRNKMSERESGRKDYQRKNADKWVALLEEENYNKKYDYLLVVDGMSISPVIFDILRKRNPNIWCANYLYDSTISLYRFQNNFVFYDKVASFDKQDCSKYGIDFLPIYWVEGDCEEIKYKFFAFGGFSVSRYNLFRSIGEYAQKNGMTYFAKVFHAKEKCYCLFLLKYLVKKIKGQPNIISPRMYHSEYVTHMSIPSSEFRRMLMQSEIIVDTVNYEQDGMTARFMWAIGLGKKIVTTNRNILSYDCYNPNQVLVIADNASVDESVLQTFVGTEFAMPNEIRKILNSWRIDNWLYYLLGMSYAEGKNV